MNPITMAMLAEERHATLLRSAESRRRSPGARRSGGIRRGPGTFLGLGIDGVTRAFGRSPRRATRLTGQPCCA